MSEQGEVADSARASSPQPRRVPVRGRVRELLDAAPSEQSGLPAGFTHFELACLVYSTDEPTAAQESAVRRAVAALVAAGQAERDRERGYWLDHRVGRHERVHGEYVYETRNPAGVVIKRPMTAADREARAVRLERGGYDEWAAAVRAGTRNR